MDKQQLLPVGNVPVGIPTSGEEYLALVRKEASELPDWTRINKKLKTDHRPTLLENHQHYFKQDTIDSIPNHLIPTLGWKRKRLEDFKKLKSQLSKINPIPLPNKEFMFQNDPQLGHVASLNQPRTIKCLSSFLHVSPDVRACKWIYSLLVKCDPLLESGDVSLLRQLLKNIRNCRSQLKESNELFIGLTLCVLLLSTEFGQKDLQDQDRNEENME